jgi:hypothetical protein
MERVLLCRTGRTGCFVLDGGCRELFRVAPTAPNTVKPTSVRRSCRRCFEQHRDRTIFIPGLWLSLLRCTGYSRVDG